MNEKLFAELMKSAGQALEHAEGKRDLRTTVLPAAPKRMSAGEIRRLRRELNASQAVFAHYCNVSTKLVQAWEGGRRQADGPALLLLRLAQTNPAILLVPSKRADAA